MIKNELELITGKENVLDTPDLLQEYAFDCSFATGKNPACVVRPASLIEVQKIVELANRRQVPLVPLSSGAPHFRGDTLPNREGTVIVDLRRLNKILRVDRANRVVIVEPGVTFGELQAELAKSGMSAYLPLSPRRTKSVLTSILEREPVTMPGLHFDSTDPMLCLEIVFGTGDRMRTGEAAGPDTLEQQWEIGKAQMSPFGPTQMDPQRLVSGAQGTIGIVTWMSLKTRFLSDFSRAFFVPNARLEPLIELSYKLTRIRFTGSIFILNGLNLAALLRHSPSEISRLSRQLPPWIMFVSCEGYGPLPAEKVQYLEADLKELASSFGLSVETELGTLSAAEMASQLAVPSSEPYWKTRYRGNLAEVFFLTTQGRTPEMAGILAETARRFGYPLADVGTYLQPVAQGTSCHCEFDLFYNPADKQETEKTREFMHILIDALEARGAFFSRPYAGMTSAAYRRSGDTAQMQKQVKAIFDPNGILNPGKLCF
ncbi:MAG TPA: FAD-binding oxidoreductase [Dehalococcoidales bacterium]|nr:FAD-binding oxidoreductase [Dehalococcoidales bacterium]